MLLDAAPSEARPQALQGLDGAPLIHVVADEELTPDQVKRIGLLLRRASKQGQAMIVEWMIYQCATALLLGLAAFAAERLVDMRRWPRRGIWAASLSACLIIPALATLEPAAAANVLAAPPTAVLQRDSIRTRAHIEPTIAEKVVSMSVGHVLPGQFFRCARDRRCERSTAD